MYCVAEMVSNKTGKAKLILSMVVLSTVTPLGVLIGLVLTLHGQTETGAHVLLVGVLQGVAGGTLLYITFFEVRRGRLCQQSILFVCRFSPGTSWPGMACRD
jgi:zinc transporter 1/2/3